MRSSCDNRPKPISIKGEKTVGAAEFDVVNGTGAPDITDPDTCFTVDVKVAESANAANERFVGDSGIEDAT